MGSPTKFIKFTLPNDPSFRSYDHHNIRRWNPCVHIEEWTQTFYRTSSGRFRILFKFIFHVNFSLSTSLSLSLSLYLFPFFSQNSLLYLKIPLFVPQTKQLTYQPTPTLHYTKLNLMVKNCCLLYTNSRLKTLKNLPPFVPSLTLPSSRRYFHAVIEHIFTLVTNVNTTKTKKNSPKVTALF